MLVLGRSTGSSHNGGHGTTGLVTNERARVRAGIVGSLPRPEWLSEDGDVRISFRLEGAALESAFDDAVSLAVRDQERAGLDFVTDGEQRRRHYIRGFVERLPGFDYSRYVPKVTRGGRYRTQAPVLAEMPRWEKPVQARDTAYTVAQSARPVKVTLPGPLTILDTFYNETGLPEEELAEHIADAVNLEAKALVEAGASIVQIDEPAFCGYLDKTAEWGVQMLDRSIAGLSVPTVVHICYGYGTPQVLEWKRHNTTWDQYAHLLPMLRNSTVSGLSLEFAASGVDPAVLAESGDKTIWYGAIDVSVDSPPETPEQVADRLRRALEYVPASRLIASTDCGLMPLGREVARQKMTALAEGARLVGR